MLDYILKYSKKPELIELTIYYYNRYIESGKKKTLPYLTEIWCEELYTKFTKASTKYSVEEMIKIIDLSRSIEKRIEIEK
jgi:hypothetical protein